MRRPILATGLVSTAILVATLFTPAHSHVRIGSDAVTPPPKPDALDLQTRHDAANMELTVTNIGSLGFDLVNSGPGTFFPIGSLQSPLFASGLWIGATVAGQTRVTVAEYSMEWVPGRVVGGNPEPDTPELRNYKMFTIHAPAPPDTTGWGDYVANAGPYGAPVGTRRFPDTSTPNPTDSVDVPGPDLPGDAAIWSVYNDADPNLHTNNAGATFPLRAEVRQTVFSTLLGPAVYVRWQIRNGGFSTWDNAYVALWSDPDLGGAGDDLVGYHAPLELGYTYNATNADNQYGATPPALGTMLVLGPLDPSSGVRRPAYAFVRYINGTDPNSFTQSYNYLRGLNADGTNVIDPITASPTRYMHTGDPVTATGWLDTNPSDRRMMLSAGPLRLAPGQSTDLVVAFIVQRGTDRLHSIERLRCKAQYARDQYFAGFPHAPEPDCDVAVPAVLFLEETQVDADGVRLVWSAGDRDAGPWALDRRRDEGAWSELALVSPDGVGRIVYDDHDVAPGDRLAYRLRDPQSGELVPGGSTSVIVPLADAGALEFAALSPDGSGPRVRFHLPRACAVRLDVFDVAGRLVRTLDWGVVEAGTHTRSVDLAGQAGRGVRIARLMAAGETRTAKLLVLDP